MATKTYEDALRAAFLRGVRVGVGYPEYDAIPQAELDVQFDAFRNELAGGSPWSPEHWANERRSRYMYLDAKRKRDHARFHHRSIDEVGINQGSCRYGDNCEWEPTRG